MNEYNSLGETKETLSESLKGLKQAGEISGAISLDQYSGDEGTQINCRITSLLNVFNQIRNKPGKLYMVAEGLFFEPDGHLTQINIPMNQLNAQWKDFATTFFEYETA